MNLIYFTTPVAKLIERNEGYDSFEGSSKFINSTNSNYHKDSLANTLYFVYV